MNRLKSLDYVKGFCILLVCVGHCGIYTGKMEYFYGSFYMPAFFLFSGFLFRERDSLKDTIRRKLETLMVLYLIWTVAPYALFCVKDLILLGQFSITDCGKILERVSAFRGMTSQSKAVIVFLIVAPLQIPVAKLLGMERLRFLTGRFRRKRGEAKA